MKSRLSKEVSFDFIRYANCWEDADVLLQGLNPEPGSKILSIGSAGDNSFSLLTCDPELVVAVDVSKIQTYLIELKKAAIAGLSYNDLLHFLGFRMSESRLEMFSKIKLSLGSECRLYWEQNLSLIRTGIIAQGKFEKYFQLFSKRILPLIHSKKTIDKLFEQKNAEEQKTFYHEKWNTWRWRLLFRIFFSKAMMGKYGRDPRFMKEVNVSVSDYIFRKAGRHLESVRAQNNFILQYNLTGDFGQLLPHYLQVDNWKKIKANIDKLHIRHGYAEDVINDYGHFKYMNLSNIFEYMELALFEVTSQRFIEGTEQGGRLAYWNLMVPRIVSSLHPVTTEHMKELSEDLSAVDKGFFYNKFIIDRVK